MAGRPAAEARPDAARTLILDSSALSTKRCYFMPLLRTGDLLFNAVVLQQRLIDRTTVYEALEAVRGGVGGMARDLFGHNVTEISTHLFGDSSHADRLLCEHTFFGVFRHALSEPVVASWRDSLKAGRHTSSLQSLGASPSHLGALSAPSLRSCKQCIDSDVDLQGFATWKLTHQVSAIDRCPYHGAALDTEIRPLGVTHARIWPLQLPGENRAPPSANAPLAPSDGYAAYLRLWQRVLTDELPWLKPRAWIQSIQAAVSALGGLDAAVDTVEKDIQRSWGVPISEISAALLLSGKGNAIREELSLRSRPKDIARRLLLYGSLDRLGLDLIACSEGDQRELMLIGGTGDRMPDLSEPVVTKLLQLADQSGLPLASIKFAELDSGFAPVAREIGIDEDSLRNFAAFIDEDLLENLLESLRFGDRSWLASELAKRRRFDRVCAQHAGDRTN